MSSGSEVPISADADAAALSLQRLRAFCESSLRRKKTSFVEGVGNEGSSGDVWVRH